MGPSPHIFFEACLTRSISTPFSPKIEKNVLPTNVKKMTYCPLPGPIWALSTPKIGVQGLSQTYLLRSYMHAGTLPPVGWLSPTSTVHSYGAPDRTH